MPSGLGKKVNFAVLCPEGYRSKALEMGAALVDPSVIMASITAQKAGFDKLLATQDFMSDLKKNARYLGPKKLMPNIKDGTLL
jgi:large subunit ribosomal protein L1